MSYRPTADFLALLRQTSGGVRMERMPGLDYVVSALARAGIINLAVSDTAPTANQFVTAWFKPSVPSWAFEGILFLWNGGTSQYEVATPVLWGALLSATALSGGTQMVTTPGPVNVLTTSDVVLVNQAVSAPITLVLPLSLSKPRGVLISDWKGDASANIITIQRSGADVFPGGAISWQIASDTGSLFFRPVPGGYAI